MNDDNKCLPDGFSQAASAYHDNARGLLFTARSVAESNPTLALLLMLHAAQHSAASTVLLAAQNLIAASKPKP